MRKVLLLVVLGFLLMIAGIEILLFYGRTFEKNFVPTEVPKKLEAGNKSLDNFLVVFLFLEDKVQDPSFRIKFFPNLP